MLLGLLLACERTPHDPPKPTPRDAATDAAVVVPIDQARIHSLDRLYTYVSTTPRERSPIEAPEVLTNAYRDWMFAYGYARAGNPARARQLAETARSALAQVMDDPVHRVLTEAFAARLAIAFASEPSTTPLPPSLELQITNLGSMERYAVDRLRESSRILGVVEDIDAIGAFATRTKDIRGPELEKLKGITDPDARAKILEQMVARVAMVDDGSTRARLLAHVLAEGRRLPAEHAKRLLGVVIAQVGVVPAPHRGQVYVAAIVLAHAVDRALIAELVDPAAAALLQAPSRDFTAALEQLVRTLGKTHRADLRTIWNQAEATALAPDHRVGSGVSVRQAAYAAGLVQLGDPRAPKMLTKLEQAVDLESPGAQYELLRTLVLAYAQLPQAEGLAAIERVARRFPTTTDDFGTNTHYAKSVLDLVDLLVVGVVDE